MSQSEVVFSDEEEYEVKWPDAQNYTMRFGRYKGDALADIIKSSRGRSYLRYLLDWDELGGYTKANIQCAMGYYGDLKASRSSSR